MKRFQNILFVTGVENSESALAHALTLAKHNQTGLTLVKAVKQISGVSGYSIPKETIATIKQDVINKYKGELEELSESYKGTVKIDIEVHEGIPFISIIQDVLRNSRDLVIKAVESEGGISSFFFSSIDMHLLRKCPCPVWLVKPGEPERIRSIAAAIDFNDLAGKDENHSLNRQILEMALSLAYREGAQLNVIHAWWPNVDANGPEYEDHLFLSGGLGIPVTDIDQSIENYRLVLERRIAKLMDEIKDWNGEEMFNAVKPRTHLIHGRARKVIAEYTKKLNADLLVMGTVGRIGVPGFFMGNTAESILYSIECSVLAVKPEGFISPVVLPED